MNKEIICYHLLQELLKNNCESPKGQVQTGPYPHARHRPVVTYNINCNFNYDAVKKLILPLKKKINSNARCTLTKKVRKKKQDFPWLYDYDHDPTGYFYRRQKENTTDRTPWLF